MKQPPRSLSDRDLHTLWEALEATVLRRFGGPVSLAKFLHQPDEHEAATFWIGLAADLIAAVAREDAALARTGEPVLLYPCEVSVTFDLGEITIACSGQSLWRAASRPLSAAVITDALGHARWGDAWTTAVAGKVRDIGPIVHADDGREFPWIAQNPPIPGPWTGAKTEELALRAAHAEALGPKKIARLYERMRKHS